MFFGSNLFPFKRGQPYRVYHPVERAREMGGAAHKLLLIVQRRDRERRRQETPGKNKTAPKGENAAQL